MPVFVVRSKGIVGFLGGRRQVAIGRSAWNGGFGVGRGRCRSSPFGGGGPCEAWWRGTRGVSCPLYVTRPRPCPPTTFCRPPPRSGGAPPLSGGRPNRQPPPVAHRAVTPPRAAPRRLHVSAARRTRSEHRRTH